MFKDDEIERAQISDDDFDAQVPQLRVDLVNAQYDLTSADFSVLIIIAGNDRIGANQVLDRIQEWMDARYIDTTVFSNKLDEAESERPRFWRYWNALPAKGRIGLYFSAWPLNIIADRVKGNLNKKGFKRWTRRAENIERDLAAGGTLILKFWVQLPKKELKDRLKSAKKDPDRAWWLEEQDWDVFEKFFSIAGPINDFYHRTNKPYAPWTIVDGTNANFRDLTVASTIRDALVQRLDNPPTPVEAENIAGTYDDLLAQVDLDQSLSKKEYKKELAKYQRKIHLLMRKAYQKKLPVVLAMEGSDAGGKGGAIRRMTGALPARSYRVIPIAAPTSEEKARHYLWRFWRQLPRAGRMVVFDRTWYGRVLVERVEGFATDAEWQRAYDEINDFEEQLADRGMVVLKFWLAISSGEQLTRFQAREVTSYKKYKITDEDYRNREKWDEYTQAVNEMVARTNKPHAPWHLVPANDKRFARIYILKTVCEALEKALK